MSRISDTVLLGEVLDSRTRIKFSDVCYSCQIDEDELRALVSYGVLEPIVDPIDDTSPWEFSVLELKRVSKAKRLKRDLGINTAGIALALELLDELERTQGLLTQLQRQYNI